MGFSLCVSQLEAQNDALSERLDSVTVENVQYQKDLEASQSQIERWSKERQKVREGIVKMKKRIELKYQQQLRKVRDKFKGSLAELRSEFEETRNCMQSFSLVDPNLVQKIVQKALQKTLQKAL